MHGFGFFSCFVVYHFTVIITWISYYPSGDYFSCVLYRVPDFFPWLYSVCPYQVLLAEAQPECP